MLRLLWIIAVVCLVLWLLSLVFGLISGPFVQVLLVIGVILLIIWLVQRGTFRR